MSGTEFVEGWLQILWRASWQAAVLATAVWAIVTVFRRHLTPNWRAALWCLPLIRLVALVVPVSSFSLFGLVELFAPARTLEPIAQQTLGHSLEMATNLDMATINEEPIRGPVDLQSNRSTDQGTVNAASPIVIGPWQGLLPYWPAWFAAVWIAGAVLSGVRFTLARRQIAQVVARSHVADSRVSRIVDIRSEKLGLRRRVECLMTCDGVGPASVGLLRPKILLPEQLSRELSHKDLVAVIEHELRHIQRWDGLIVGLLQLLKCLHWFNPVFYWCERQLRLAVEQAVDRSTLQTLGTANVQSYGKLLIQVAQQTSHRYGLTQMAGRHQSLKRRIFEIAMPSASTPWRSVLALGLMLGLAVGLLSDSAPSQASPQTSPAAVTSTSPTTSQEKSEHFVTGVVFDEDTNEPISDAAIQVLVPSESDISKRVLWCKTDAAGRYRLAVPIGEIKIWFPPIKPGYWVTQPSQNMVALTTSKEMPLAEYNLRAKKAPLWKVKYVGEIQPQRRYIAVLEIPDDELRRKALAGEPWSSQKDLNQWNSQIEDDGTGAFTQIGDSGKFIVGAVSSQAELIVDSGFDNTHVTSADFEGATNSTLLKDAKGRTAKIIGATIELNSSVPTIVFTATGEQHSKIRIVGTVLDPDGKPVADAEVRAAIHQTGSGGGVWEEVFAKSQADGAFELRVEFPKVYEAALKAGVTVAANLRKAGFAVTDSKPVKLEDLDTTIDVGRTSLRAGFDLPIRTVDAQGKPLPGASITATSSLSQYIHSIRTDSEGEAILKGMPADLVRVQANHGQQFASTKLLVEATATNPRAEIKLAPAPAPAEPNSAAKPTPVPIGTLAPPLSVQAWSDGKPRKLEDLRGKIVVLDFWGTWCGPCVSAIPAMQKLADDYGPRGVVFLGVHTADGTIEQINKLKQFKKWAAPTGLDEGTSITDGRTANAYGVRGYPAIVLIDGQGVIRYRSDLQPADMKAFMEDQRKLAEANDIPWPLPQNPTAEEAVEIGNKLMVALISR
ncbi:MAG: redoxin domain-containing protein, partial [Planctomycetales bacterium]|nr:redoxin domain-containing protein [Planctomycetales bacterium]